MGQLSWMSDNYSFTLNCSFHGTVVDTPRNNVLFVDLLGRDRACMYGGCVRSLKE